MAKKQKIDNKEKAADVLQKEVEDAKRELITLQLDNQMRKLKNTRSIFLKRKEIARLLTELRIKEITKEVKHG